MGTNYYTKLKECKHCNRYEEVHLGKSSAGWQFSFQYNGGEYYKNIEQMKEWLKGKQILNEYEEKVSYEEFWEMVKNKQKSSNSNHASKHTDYNNRVIDGYSFTDCEFS